MKIHVLPPEDWAKLAPEAHLIAFGRARPASHDRIDFALVGVEGETPVGYVTCREHDHETLYWQFGGTMPGTRGTMKPYRYFEQAVSWAWVAKYKRITLSVENDNTVMLKLALKAGFRVTGVRNFQGTVLLEHVLEF